MRALALALVALLPLVLAPSPAQAQVPVVPSTIAVTLYDPGGNGLPPGAESGLLVTFTYSAQPGARQGLDPTSDSGIQPTRVRFEVVKAPAWVNATRFEPAEVNLTLPTSGNAAGNTTFIVSVAPDAPARQREEFVVRAIAEPNGNIQEARGESAPIKLRARVVTLVNVTAGAESPLFLPGGRWTYVPFTVRNDGNDEVTAILNVTTRPEDSQIDLPEKTLTIPRGGSATVEIGIRTPWTAASLGTLELEAQPLADDGEPPAVRAAVDVTAQSAVPAPPLAPLLALVVAGLALRRGRGRT